MTGRMSSTVLLGDSAAGPGDVLSTHIYRPNEASESDEEELRSKLHAAWIAKGRIAGSTAGCGVEALALPHSCTPLCNQLRGDMKSEPQFWHLAEACTIPTSAGRFRRNRESVSVITVTYGEIEITAKVREYSVGVRLEASVRHRKWQKVWRTPRGVDSVPICALKSRHCRRLTL